MSKEVILKAEGIAKQYRLGKVGSGTLSHDLNRWWAGIRGKEDPYSKIGEANDRETKGSSDYVWALKDISFEVKRGEVLGIIGKNGAGKSTLLKILSRVTAPTAGVIKTKGRIASLLEVGTGFHAEMTGRENIFLNGAILGMTKKEIRSKIDEIIEFSGCQRYIDTPVKRYSSGMTVRLAFAVAAFLEPEILVVDEVLAVGDAEFQKKAIGKMQDISRGEGRTVLFVSHNMAAVKSLCTAGIVLKNGGITFKGKINDSVAHYLNENSNYSDTQFFNSDNIKINGIRSVKLLVKNSFINHDEKILVEVKFNNFILDCNIGVALLNSSKSKVFTTVKAIDSRTDCIYCEIPSNLLLKGAYSFDVATFKNELVFEYVHDICLFQIVDLINDYKIYGDNIGDIKVNCRWSLNL